MDKAAIRSFAIWSRKKLISDVAYRAGLMGITADGIADKLPQSTNSVHFYDIGTSEPYQITGKEITQRSNLAFLIKRKAKSSDYSTAYTSIIEEVAYTWFNRLIAIRFMEVNDYLPSHVRVLSSESGKIEPDIVTSPFDVDLGITEKESAKILELKQNNESDELFKLLFIKQCNKLSVILPRLFEKTDDYTELLFNCSYVDQEGIVYRLTHDIPEEDFDIDRGGQVEIIGWLYQYYNAELKDDTFALLKKNVKITKERIPSATQLFTPDWIVRYMVENSLGRLWTEGHSNTSSQLRGNWKYYLEEAEQEPDVQVALNDIRKEYTRLRPEDIKLIDPCMGSGHILVYAFDVLMQIYESEGYSQRDAAVQILENNIFGLDIDDRAAQLAYFAVMMKARQYNRRILDGKHDCHVLAIQESNGMSTLKTYIAPFEELSDAALRLIKTYINAKEYGSILNIPMTLDEIDALESRLEEIRNNRSDDVEELMVEAVILNDFPPLLKQAKIMVQKYGIVVTNPPYMGSNNMSSRLSDYVKDNYPDSKSDLSTVCMEKTLSMCKPFGYMAMINIPVWMFISSFEKMRKKLISQKCVVNMAHFGRGVFGSDFGTTSFVIQNGYVERYESYYLRLFNKSVEVTDVGKKEKWFIERKGQHTIKQDVFLDIPGYSIAYWVNSNAILLFSKLKSLSYFGETSKGIITGDNSQFLRLWHEVSSQSIRFDANTYLDSFSDYDWYPCNKGGDYRKWYGNFNYVIYWNNNGDVIMQRHEIKKRNCQDYKDEYKFVPSITWTSLSIGEPSFRYSENALSESAGMTYFPKTKLPEFLGFLNSKVAIYFLNIINPTLNYTAGSISSLPFDTGENDNTINELVADNLQLSKNDWNSFETSFGFKKHPLI